jgi:GT2 family glycosyltransferase
MLKAFSELGCPESIGLIERFPTGASVQSVVAIPVRDEEAHIAVCLDALLGQCDRAGRRVAPGAFGILLLLNNCRDRTLAACRKALSGGDTPSLLANVVLPPAFANAGFARGLAMDLGAQWLECHGHADGVVLTTDADSRVSTDWLTRNMAAINAGCGAVAGRVIFDPAQMAALPSHLGRRHSDEHAYEQALLELRAIIDPIVHDPWPNHWTASGASLAVTLRAYREVGGLPSVSFGEDRALASALQRRDIPIRYDPHIVVTTSARLNGRAPGGTAETLRRRCECPDLPGDAALEALPNAMRRYLWRRRLRDWHRNGTLCEKRSQAGKLDLPAGFTAWRNDLPFGTVWSAIEAASPTLDFKPLSPHQLRFHTAAARAVLFVLRQRELTGSKWHLDDIPEFAAVPAGEQMARGIA